MGWSRCPNAAYGQHEPGQTGRCLWCGQQVSSPWPRPKPRRGQRAELDLAYEYFYDPDFGTDIYDSY